MSQNQTYISHFWHYILAGNDEDDDFKTACERLNESFSPTKKVALFEIYKFRQVKLQQDGETLDAYAIYRRLYT